MNWRILEIAVNFFQIYVIYKIFDIYYEKKFKFKYLIELVIVFMTMLLSYLNYIISIHSNPFAYLLFYCLIYTTTLIIFNGNVFSKIAVIFFNLTVLGVCEMLSAVFVSTVSGINLNSIQEQNFGRFETMILSQTIFLFIYLILKRKKNITNYNINIIGKKYYLYLGAIFFLTIFTIVIVVFLYGKFNTDLDYVNSYLVLLTILVILLSILSIGLANSILKDMSQKHKNEIELQHIKMENIYFSDVNKALEEIRIIRHDMRGELAIIHGYNELNQKYKIRNHIEKKLKEMDVQLVPQIDEDSIITSFLNFKVNEAQIKGINVDIQSNIHEDSKIVVDKEDLCRIINNIMNNAIEANNQCDEKYIKIEFIVEDDYIYIGSENPFYGNVLKKGNTILTKKSDNTKHGYGLKSIKAIAEKYNGHVSVDHDDNVFYVEVDVLNKLLI